MIVPAGDCRLLIAMPKTLLTSVAGRPDSIDQPAGRRGHAENTTAQYACSVPSDLR
jgi:hypothetical protein